MGRSRRILSATAAAVVLTAGTAIGQGIVPDRSTIVTISAPVSVPGVVLPAGEYLFRLADSKTNRNIVQIYDKDRTKIFATLIAIPAERNEASGDAVITFRESPANQAPALRYWYFAGEKAGNEFAYPKQQAMEIARASREPVMAMDTTSSEIAAMQQAELERIDPNSTPVSGQAAEPAAPAAAAPSAPPATAVEPQPPTTATEPQSQAAASEPTPAQPAAPAAREAAATEPQPTGTSGRDMTPAQPATSSSASATQTDRELPRTAGELPLVALFGFLALGAAAGARALRGRMMV